MFMKRCPAEIDAERQPDLACLQSLLFDEEQSPAGAQPGLGSVRLPRGQRSAAAHARALSPAELARMYKNEGNDYFRERDYKRAVVAYSAGLRQRCGDPELDAVLHTNRGAAQFHLGTMGPVLPLGLGGRLCAPPWLLLPCGVVVLLA